MKMNEKGQMAAPAACMMTADDFKKKDGTSIYWLGGGGAMINSHGTIIMIDPVLEGYDLPLLIDIPIQPQNVIDHVVNPERVIVLAPGQEYKIES